MSSSVMDPPQPSPRQTRQQAQQAEAQQPQSAAASPGAAAHTPAVAGQTQRIPSQVAAQQVNQAAAQAAQAAHAAQVQAAQAQARAAQTQSVPSQVQAPQVTQQQRYSIGEFVQRTGQQNRGQGFFELETKEMLEVNMDQPTRVWTKMGSMVAYHGQIKFKREGMLEGGIGKLLKKAISGEGAKLTKAEGTGKLYLADNGKKVSVIQLEGDSIVVNGNDLLAFEDGVAYDIKMMKKVSAMASGGLFNVELNGRGMIAITTHCDPVTLRVTPNQPVTTDPNATVAWSSGVTPKIKTDISLKTFVGRGSGETFQTEFSGDGFVVIQPYEEVYFQAGK